MFHSGLSIVVHCIPTLHSQCPLLVGPLCSEHTQHSVDTGRIAEREGVRRSKRETERKREIRVAEWLGTVWLGIVNPVGTGGRPPARMGWSENRTHRERERERERDQREIRE